MSGSSTLEVAMAYDDEGGGDALLFVHGHPFNRSMWRPQMDHFGASGWRVIAPDLRGYGDTVVVPGTTTLDQFARDICALLDRLELDEIVITGLSMGGQIVMECQRLFPSRLRAIVLADTSPYAETDAGKRQRNDVADRLLREGMAPYADEVLTKMVAVQNLEALPAVAEHVLSMMRSTPPAGAAAALRGRAERPDYVDLIAQIAVPTLVVVGRHDEFTPISDAEFMQERIPNASLVVIEGAAHMPNLERPTEFNAALQGFLDRLPAPTRRS